MVPAPDAISRLRSLSQVSVQSSWHIWAGDLPLEQAINPCYWQQWPVAELNHKHHLAWSKGQQVRWLGQVICVPTDLHGFELAGLQLRLALTWWAESTQIFVDGRLVQAGDLFDCSTRLLLSPSVQPGGQFAVAIQLVSPGHDDGALVRSLALYESAQAQPEPGFVADELQVLHTYLQGFYPEKLAVLHQAIDQLDWAALPDRSQFNRSLERLREQLLPIASLIKQRHIYLLGHAHLDLAWLWPVDETWAAAERTFESVLSLQADFPDLIFGHSTPALYDWVKTHRPALFTRIRSQIQTGRWEVIGGLWVEPELNLIGGEAIARQLLYGQRYCQELTGQINPIAWLPDTFGFNWQLPQFLKQGGIDYFVTQKLRWNDSTPFPHELFYWQAPNGSQVLSLMSAPIGEGIDPVKIADYACDWEKKTGIPDVLWLPGVGDHGGGPTRDMLHVARRWQRSPFFPEIKFIRAIEYLKHLEARGQKSLAEEIGVRSQELEEKSSWVKGHDSLVEEGQEPLVPRFEALNQSVRHDSFPIWQDELYLEFHRGCYTTHADQKQWNCRSQELLYQAELFASLATIAAQVAYPRQELEQAWKRVLFNQFHDILPGSSIPQVFVDANQEWQAVQQVGSQILERSLKALASQICLPVPPTSDSRAIVVFNALNWARSAIGRLRLPEGDWQVVDLAGQSLERQMTESGEVLFFAEAIPSVGYRVFWLVPGADDRSTSNPKTELAAGKDLILENDDLRVEVDPTTGDLSSVFDRVQNREVLSAPGNQLQGFQDQGQYWDAWNIDPNYASHPLPPAKLLEITVLSQGPLEQRIRVVRQIGRSTFQQDYVLQRHSPLLQIQTKVDWQEPHVLVKAAFTFAWEAESATYAIPCGAIQRPTRPTTPAEQAKWEVPALGWADLGTGDYGASLLSDYKHGYDSQPDQLRLSLLRGCTWPDPQADRGQHCFTYALYPHAQTWQVAQTVRQSRELAIPLQVIVTEPQPVAQSAQLAPQGEFLNLGSDNLVLMALKQAEEDAEQWVMRCYEGHGETGAINLQSDLNLVVGDRLNLLELPVNSENPALQIFPWSITSWTLYPTV
ncbi:MAG: alpha-mannosidase [Leptolyngbyaceae cyanobacterium]